MSTTTQFPDVWVFDSNRRVYSPAEKGQTYSRRVIYREHWCKLEVVGETRVSWLTSYGEKIPKKGRRGVAFSQAEVDDDVWAQENRYRLSDAVRSCDTATLRKIAAILHPAE